MRAHCRSEEVPSPYMNREESDGRNSSDGQPWGVWSLLAGESIRTSGSDGGCTSAEIPWRGSSGSCAEGLSGGVKTKGFHHAVLLGCAPHQMGIVEST